ncbi:MAG: PTS transporter subunit EIIA [Coprobacillus sp.]|nr:PTS transporter subunit EIIA [Coprobacillus sp.]
MKKRHIDLIQFLKSKNKPLNSQEIADYFHVSNRSIKNYVREINSKYQNSIIITSHQGYEINKKVLPLFNIMQNKNIPQTDEERSFYIIKQFILEYKSNIDLFDLCDYLSVGYSTLKSLISKMNKMYSSYNIRFICKNDYLQIIGNDKNFRQLISYVISEESKVHFLDIQKLSEYFKSISIDNLLHIISSIFKKYNYYLNDFTTINLLLHFSILLDRKMNDINLESNQSQFFQIEDSKEKELLNELFELLEEEFLVQFNNSEKFEIYLLFKSNAHASNQDDLIQLVGKEIIELINHYIQQIYNLYMIDLSSKAFITPLSLHIKNLIFRLKNNNFIKNPMTNIIKYNNPTVFDIATFIGINLMEYYNIYINEDEIAFLAIHIGAEIEKQNIDKFKIPAILFAPFYHNINSTILNSLLSSFGNQIYIISNIHDKDDLIKTINENDDFPSIIIFTTIPLENIDNCTVIQINPLNISNQYVVIQEAIIENKYKHNIYNFQKNFHNFFEKDLFTYYDIMSSRDEVLSYLCQQLLTKNYVDDTFHDKVCSREHAATTAFDGIAIPHSVEMDAIKTSVAIAISKKGIQWGNQNVSIVFLIAINKADRKTFKELYEFIISLCNNKDIMKLIKECSSFNTFKKIINNHL